MPSVSALTAADPVLLVQLSDSHLFAETDGTLLGMNTADSLQRVIDLVLAQQPRIDLMLGADANARARIRQRLGLDADARIVLYAPTWRGSLDGASLDVAADNRARLRARSIVWIMPATHPHGLQPPFGDTRFSMT